MNEWSSVLSLISNTSSRAHPDHPDKTQLPLFLLSMIKTQRTRKESGNEVAMAHHFHLLLLIFLLALACLLLLSSRNKTKTKGSQTPRFPPGPKGWPILGNLPQLGPKPHHTLEGMSRVYGPLIHLRFGSTHVVVVSSAHVASLLFKSHDANFSSRPVTSAPTYVGYGGRGIVFSPYGPAWRMLRKVCTLRLFSPRALDEFSRTRHGEVASMLRGMAACGGDVVEVGRWLGACTANSLTAAMQGRRLFGGEEAGEFREMVVELLTVGGAFIIGDYVPWLHWLDLEGMVARMKKVGKRFDAFLDKIIEEEDVDEHKHMLSKLMELNHNADGDGGTLTHQEIKATLLDMLLAGTDTTSSTVEWALTELVRHPDLMRRAQLELDSVVGRHRLVRETDLPDLPFMQAVFKETLRLHPPTPLSLPRLASESCDLLGYDIPKSATLLVNIWAIGRDPASWPSRPLEFWPDRFLPGGESAHVDVRSGDGGLNPFGGGRRMCVGMSLGVRMVQLMTASLVQAFEWEVPPPSGTVLSTEEAFGLTIQKAVPLTLCPIPRLPSSVYESRC